MSTRQHKLEDFGVSALDPRTVQRELMGDDLDLAELLVYLKGKLAFDAVERVVAMDLTRTIEGASTVKVSLSDYDRSIIRSGILSSRLDINLDGLWFRLVKVERKVGSDDLELTFEDREIAILRTFPGKKAPNNGVIIQHRSQVTRAEFILNLIREALPGIKVVIPELHKVQLVEETTGFVSDPYAGTATSAVGIPETINDVPETAPGGAARRVEPRLTVKGERATKEQIKNANAIITTGQQLGVSRKLLVVSIMVAIVESTLHNYAGGDLDSVGLFQQRPSWGSFEDRHDPATAARLFFRAAIKQDKLEPTVPYWVLAADVQRPRRDLRNVYDLYKAEAEKWVTAAGVPGGDKVADAADANNMGKTAQFGSDFLFYRGDPQDGGKNWKRENSWDCIQRLANEVGWRAFFVSGAFYYINDDDLFKTKPIMTITDQTEGLDSSPGFDYDSGKKSASVNFPVRVGKWLAPPGAVVVVNEMGPVNGRWLVNEFTRSVFDSRAEIVIKKPLPTLPEPALQNITDGETWGDNSADEDTDTTTGTGLAGYVNPLGTPMGLNSEFLRPDGAEGVPNGRGGFVHGGKDWFAPSGSWIVAPTSGEIIRMDAPNPPSHGGQVFGGVMAMRELAPNEGRVWVFRHISPNFSLPVGSQVSPGQKLVQVYEWPSNPSGSHTHIEIWKTASGGYQLSNMIDPVRYIQGLDS